MAVPGGLEALAAKEAQVLRAASTLDGVATMETQEGPPSVPWASENQWKPTGQGVGWRCWHTKGRGVVSGTSCRRREVRLTASACSLPASYLAVPLPSLPVQVEGEQHTTRDGKDVKRVGVGAG